MLGLAFSLGALVSYGIMVAMAYVLQRKKRRE